MEPEAKEEEESSVLGTIRSKCITQLLLLGAIDSIQVWIKYISYHILGFILAFLVSVPSLCSTSLLKSMSELTIDVA